MSDLYIYCEYASISTLAIPSYIYTEYFKLGKDIFSENIISSTFICTHDMKDGKFGKLIFSIRNIDDIINYHGFTTISKIYNSDNIKNLYDVFKLYCSKSTKMKKFCDNIINTNRVLDKKDIDCTDRYEFANDGKKSLIKLLNPNYK